MPSPGEHRPRDPGLDGIFVLGGDQDVAMLVVANTRFEAALANAQAAGAVTSGNSAGAAVESADMIAGFTGSNGPEQGLEAGFGRRLDVRRRRRDKKRGLIFGLQGVLLDQHVFQRGRIARLINASFTEDELGIGVDANTAATIEGGTNLTKIGGDTGAFVADSLTYGAPASSTRPDAVDPQRCDPGPARRRRLRSRHPPADGQRSAVPAPPSRSRLPEPCDTDGERSPAPGRRIALREPCLIVLLPNSAAPAGRSSSWRPAMPRRNRDQGRQGVRCVPDRGRRQRDMVRAQLQDQDDRRDRRLGRPMACS